MVVFTPHSTYIRVIRLSKLDGETSENLGKLVHCGTGYIGQTEWLWDGCCRNRTSYNERLDGSEKKAILRMLNYLNGIAYRPQNELLDQWRKLVGC